MPFRVGQGVPEAVTLQIAMVWVGGDVGGDVCGSVGLRGRLLGEIAESKRLA